MATSHSCSTVLGKPCQDYCFGSLMSVVRKVCCQQLSGGKGKGLVLPTRSRRVPPVPCSLLGEEMDGLKTSLLIWGFGEGSLHWVVSLLQHL